MQVLQTVPVAESTKKGTLCLQSNFSVLCTTLPLCNFVRSSSLHLVCMPGKVVITHLVLKVEYWHTRVNIGWVDLASTCNLTAVEVDIGRQRVEDTHKRRKWIWQTVCKTLSALFPIMDTETKHFMHRNLENSSLCHWFVLCIMLSQQREFLLNHTDKMQNV